jgi:CheY-like chemotaxis protein
VREAIAILEGRLDINVVFTDIQMPGSMDGLKLAAAVRDRWPPIMIVATSGRVKLGPGDLPICQSPTVLLKSRKYFVN